MSFSLYIYTYKLLQPCLLKPSYCGLAIRCNEACYVSVVDMLPAQVSTTTVFKTANMPEIGLKPDLEWPLRIYVLECENKKQYVGIVPSSKLCERLADHWAGRGADFTRVNKPQKVCFVHPAPNSAAEGYMYLSLLGNKPAGSIGQLGGWVQNDDKPAPYG